MSFSSTSCGFFRDLRGVLKVNKWLLSVCLKDSWHKIWEALDKMYLYNTFTPMHPASPALHKHQVDPSVRGEQLALMARELPLRKQVSAFSLVETTLAIGVVAFALVAMLGLLPVGLTSFREAMDASTSSRILQRVSADLRQGSSVQAQQPILYFDEQGDETTAAASDGKRALYHVNTLVQPATSLPGGASSSLTTVTVEIVKNPQSVVVPRDPATLAFLAQPGMPVWRYPVYIATQSL